MHLKTVKCGSASFTKLCQLKAQSWQLQFHSFFQIPIFWPPELSLSLTIRKKEISIVKLMTYITTSRGLNVVAKYTKRQNFLPLIFEKINA